jgi:S-adenosylmethionine synthetase
MTNYLFTSESVGIGHPDKICDQISDAILDECLRQDPGSRVACETLVGSGLVVLAGEITTEGQTDFQEIARRTIKNIGYRDFRLGFDYHSCGIIVSIHKQSPDIARGIDKTNAHADNIGAGDQGIMFGYACDETPQLMPLPIMLAHKLVRTLKDYQDQNTLPYLRPDGKSQVTIEYNKNNEPVRIHTIVLSAQHREDAEPEQVHKDLTKMIHDVLPADLLDENTRYFINPTGRFVIGGPAGDCGLTGRKTIVDTYGGRGHHGGGAFSGKDPTKVDRSASYAARWVAKNIVAAKLARTCEVQISYAIGVPYPLSIKVDTFGTGEVSERELEKIIPKVFDLSPKGIIEELDLLRPIYQKTAFGGHFGREDPDFTWEATNKVDALLKELSVKSK